MIIDKHRKKKVIVAMSGGIDSSFVAWLLKKQGYSVHGIYFNFLNDIVRERIVKKIARKIRVPLVIRDARQEFKKGVIKNFLLKHAAGQTPNPCVVCNQRLKFNLLIEELVKLKADYAATGHYARLRQKFSTSGSGNSKILYRLYEAKDKTKDQSYFLHNLSQKQLSKIIFPLGDYDKSEVKKLISKLKLPFEKLGESQNICFIREKYPDNFLKKRLKMKIGKITDTRGRIIGQHRGLPLYTIGQRRGINIGGKGPYFVIAKRSHTNELIVSNNKMDAGLWSKSANLEKVNWIGEKPKLSTLVFCRTRYRNPKTSAIIKKNRNCTYKIVFKKSQRAVTPGQSVVFYAKNGQVLGGGIIY